MWHCAKSKLSIRDARVCSDIRCMCIGYIQMICISNLLIRMAYERDACAALFIFPRLKWMHASGLNKFYICETSENSDLNLFHILLNDFSFLFSNCRSNFIAFDNCCMRRQRHSKIVCIFKIMSEIKFEIRMNIENGIHSFDKYWLIRQYDLFAVSFSQFKFH